MVKLMNTIPTFEKRSETLEWIIFSLGVAMLAIAVIGTALPADIKLVDDATPATETLVF